jgi:hypothetical protein
LESQPVSFWNSRPLTLRELPLPVWDFYLDRVADFSAIPLLQSHWIVSCDNEMSKAVRIMRDTYQLTVAIIINFYNNFWDRFTHILLKKNIWSLEKWLFPKTKWLLSSNVKNENQFYYTLENICFSFLQTNTSFISFL